MEQNNWSKNMKNIRKTYLLALCLVIIVIQVSAQDVVNDF